MSLKQVYTKQYPEIIAKLIDILAYEELMILGKYGNLTKSQGKQMEKIKKSVDDFLEEIRNKGFDHFGINQ